MNTRKLSDTEKRPCAPVNTVRKLSVSLAGIVTQYKLPPKTPIANSKSEVNRFLK